MSRHGRAQYRQGRSCMLDEVVTAIATGAAGNIVASMLNGRVDALRAQFARMFRHGTEQERSVVLSALEDDAVALLQRRASETDLTAHPEAGGDIEAFASAPVISKTMNIGAQHNYGSGPFIGGDNYGNIHFREQR